MSGQNIKLHGVPLNQQKARDLRKKKRDEQRPSTKNRAVRAAKMIKRKLNNFIEDEEKIDRRMGNILGSIDEGFQKMSPSSSNRWLKSGSYKKIYAGPFASGGTGWNSHVSSMPRRKRH
jgi:hypothetical protein